VAGEHKESKNNIAGNLEQQHHFKQLQPMKKYVMNFHEHHAIVCKTVPLHYFC
jgi:hypothetical protein